MNEEILKELAEGQSMRFVGLAGPGTGKSFTFKTITKRQEFSGKRILILSFINKLVDDLKNDFNEYSNVDVLTLHSFALSEYQRITSEESVELVDDLDEIISQDYEFLEDNQIKFSKKICEIDLTDDEAKFYETRANYYKNKARLYSFNSIIHKVNQIYNQDGRHVTDKYDLILVDEFQDFNHLEYEFIKHLNSKSKVVLVGDDDQSLYDWKYAQPTLIRTLYKSSDSVPFSLDYCYRCPKPIVDLVNSLIVAAKKKGYLQERADGKKYLFPHKPSDEGYAVSAKYPKIHFVVRQSGSQLIYQLAKRINDDVAKEQVPLRILVMAPSYLKPKIYEGLSSKGFNVVDYELFADEKINETKHKRIFEIFETLILRKTDGLMLRKALQFYHSNEEIKEIVKKGQDENKKIWNILSDDTKTQIETDILLYKKVKSGSDHLTPDELVRLSQLFNLKNLLSKMIKGFGVTRRSACEVELTTVMSSKGLSADLVYYIGVDDRCIIDKKVGNLTDRNICEFLVGITRSKKKLTLFSLYEEAPALVGMLDSSFIETIKIRGR